MKFKLYKLNLFAEILLISFSSPFYSYSQSPFQKIALADSSSYLSIANCTDGNIFYCGFWKDSNVINPSALLVKSDINGNSIWSKIFNIPVTSLARKVIGTTDGGALVAGMFGDSLGHVDTTFVAKMDSTGNMLWSGSFTLPVTLSTGDHYKWFPEEIIETLDSGYVIVVNAHQYYSFHYQYLPRGSAIIKLSKNGSLEWIKKLSNNLPGGDLRTFTVTQANNSSFYLAGQNSAPPNVNWLMRLDSVGNLQWTKSFRPDTQFVTLKIFQELNSNFKLYGKSYGYTLPSIMTFDSGATFLSSKRFTYSGTYFFRSMAIVKLNNGEKFITGQANDSPISNSCIVKLDSADQPLFCKKIYSIGDRSHSDELVFTNDSCLILIGDSARIYQANGFVGIDLTKGAGTILKTDNSFNTPCSPDTFSLTYSDYSETIYPISFSSVPSLGWNSINFTLSSMLTDSIVSCPTTDVKNIADENSFIIFPNPAHSTITLNLNKTSEIKIIDLSGRVVFSKYIKTKEKAMENIDISFLSSGIYLVRIADVIKKLVKT